MSKNTQFSIKKIPTNRPLGKLIFDGPHTLHLHEYKALNVLRRFGYQVTHIAPSHLPNVRTPDINWHGSYWEVKTISGINYNNVLHAIQSAKKQSANIVIYIPKNKRPISNIIREATSGIIRKRGINKILVITNDQYCFLSKDLLK